MFVAGSRMTMDVKAQAPKSVAPSTTTNNATQECAGCGKHITERYHLIITFFFYLHLQKFLLLHVAFPSLYLSID